MAAAKVPITFRVYRGDRVAREETLLQPVIKVGKLSSSHLRLEDDSVSRMHAVIEVSGPADVSIIDLGSTRGTFVNGQKVNKARLQSGDTILIGEIKVEIAIGRAVAEEGDDEPTRVQDRAVDPVTPPRPSSAPAAAATPGVRADSGSPRRATPLLEVQPSSRSASPPIAAAPPAPAKETAAPAAAAPAAAPLAMGQMASDAGVDDPSARAVEVAAMLGDSVISVKHCINPRGGKVTALTYGLFALAVLLLFVSAIAFSVAVGNAKLNKAALREWVEVESLPYHDFRPRRISLVYDWLAFGGLGGGLVCLTIGLMRVREERQSPYFRIGRAADVDVAVEDVPYPSFPLIAPSGDDFVVNVVHGMEGDLTIDGHALSLAALPAQRRARPSPSVQGAMEIPVPQRGRIRVATGLLTFLVASVPQPRRSPAPLFAGITGLLVAFFAGSAAFHLGTLGLLELMPPDTDAIVVPLGGLETRTTYSESKAEEEPKQEEELKKDQGQEAGGSGTKMALDEGKMGKEEADREAGRYALENKEVDPQLARQQARDEARQAGIAGALQGDVFASLTGTADFSSGLDDRTVYGGFAGDEVGEMRGGFGFGLSGAGPGGGGTGWGTIGAGRYGTIGHGSGTGSGYGAGSGRGGMRGRRSMTPEVRIGNATATGDLDKNIIRRYIRRMLPRIKYCYEKQLLVRPGLEGTVVTNFQISPTGAVLNAAASGVAGEVSSCVADVIKQIQFPKPRGGGLVQVRYPFNFRPTGS